MEPFFDVNKDYFSARYLPLLARRFWSFKIALSLFLQLAGQSILETGCVRRRDDWDAGNSSVIFAEFAAKFGKDFHTIDNNPEAVELTKALTKAYEANTDVILGDSIEVLKRWDKMIDLLYLDSLDTDPNNAEVAKKAQEHQLQELELAYPHLTRNAIVLLDDNYFANGGKTALSKEFLSQKGWLQIMDYEQSLWLRPHYEK